MRFTVTSADVRARGRGGTEPTVYGSTYCDQMRDPRTSWRYHEAVLEEIAGERAHTLGRAGQQLKAALADYRAVLAGGSEETAQVEAALVRARDAAWALVVQRECAGFRSRDLGWLREHWQVPEEVLRRI